MLYYKTWNLYNHINNNNTNINFGSPKILKQKLKTQIK